MNKKNKNIINLLYLILLLIFILVIYKQFFYKCEECEGINDGSYCMPNKNKLFYLKSKLGKKIQLDFDSKKLKLDAINQTAFHVRGCLRDVYKITYLRYNSNVLNFTTGFKLISVDNKMGFSSVKDLTDTNEDILFIKRVYTTSDKYVRLGIRHNKKYYWYNETETGDWLWTTDLKKANSFQIVYY
jgi:hypothetical protein